VAYVGQKRGLEKSWRGGVEGLLAALESESPELAGFFRQPFLASSFYDVFPLAAISCHLARLSGRPLDEMVRQGAAAQLRRDLEGVYSFILNASSPQQAFGRVVTVTNQYFDFSPLETPRLEANTAVLTRRRFPVLLATWYGPVAEGYFAAALESAGAKAVTATARIESQVEGPGGVDLGDFELQATWS
jgi:hypothetical protein